MIRPSDKLRTPQEAIKDFSDWAWILTNARNELIVTIAVYVDDSGTHDRTGKLPGSREAIFGAIAAPVEEWCTFSGRWQTVLTKYNIPYFHFCEWSDAFHEQRKHGHIKSGLFKGFNASQLDLIVTDLARIAGEGSKQVYGMGLSADFFQADKEHGFQPKDADPYIEAVRRFFDEYGSFVSDFKPVWRRMSTHFVFDRTDRNFSKRVHDVFDEAKKQNQYFDKIAFADKKTDLPLQAADMVAYRSRQQSQNFRDDKVKANWPEVDEPLFQSVFTTFSKRPSLFKKYATQMVAHEALLKHFKKQREE